MILEHSFILEYETSLRMACFVVLLLLLAALEYNFPKRISRQPQSPRRCNNFALLALDYLAVKLLIPIAACQLAVVAAVHEFGLFNIIKLPFILTILLTIVIFDLLIYLQHLAFHKSKLLWRIHRVHHTDREFDVSTGIRFHPFEIVLSLVYKLIAICLLGPPAVAVLLYEVLLNSASLFTHSNIAVSRRLDKLLRLVLVTPDMHRIHHSVIARETDSNYGNLFSCWDRLFNTYIKQPKIAHQQMTIGLDEFQSEASTKLLKLLILPVSR